MNVFITGITGTLGTAIAKHHLLNGDNVFGCARDETKAVQWLSDNPRMGFPFIADARTLGNSHTLIGDCIKGVHRLYHCAAMKHVDLCAMNPQEAVAQNIDLTGIIASTCNEYHIDLVFISSDKACLPQEIYGATKLIGEKIVTQYGGRAIRLGNLIGSSGSVFKKWKKQVEAGQLITLTDARCTRFFIAIERAAQIVCDTNWDGVAVPGMAAVSMGEVAKALGRYSEIGLRPGETLHQSLAAEGESIEKIEFDYVFSPSSETAPKWDVKSLLRVAGIYLND